MPKRKWSVEIAKRLRADDWDVIRRAIKSEYRSYECFPEKRHIFRAFRTTPLPSVKVVILGQDPYPTKGNAMGLAFAVQEEMKYPASLRNIMREMEEDTGSKKPLGLHQAKQGVLLLNTALTVREGKPGSHLDLWKPFTESVIATLQKKSVLVWMLWGAKALKYEELIRNSRHLVLRAAHPSPLARGAFFGCRHFSQANKYLKSQGNHVISW